MKTIKAIWNWLDWDLIGGLFLILGFIEIVVGIGVMYGMYDIFAGWLAGIITEGVGCATGIAGIVLTILFF